MRYDHYSSDCQPRRKPRKWPKVIVGSVAFLIFLGWLTERDIEHHAKVVRQMECAPAMEMDMPIDMGSVRL